MSIGYSSTEADFIHVVSVDDGDYEIRKGATTLARMPETAKEYVGMYRYAPDMLHALRLLSVMHNCSQRPCRVCEIIRLVDQYGGR